MKQCLAILIMLGGTCGFASSPAQTPFSGWLDLANCATISGWAWDSSQPDKAIDLDLYDGSLEGTPIGTVEASTYRPDLKRAGIGNGVHAFFLPVPAELKDNRLHTILATIAGTRLPIQIGQNTFRCPAEATGYRYYATDSKRLTSASSNGATRISATPVPDGSNAYEAFALLNLKSSGGTYSLYLHASPDAVAGPAASGSYYAVELQNPTFTEKGCTATLAISKRTSDEVTTMNTESVACNDGMALRAVYTGEGRIGVWVDHSLMLSTIASEIASGQPGVGVRSAPEENGIAYSAFGQLDRMAPGPLLPADIQVNAKAKAVELRWPRLADDADGTGVGYYTVSRDGAVVAELSRVAATFTDKKVAPGTTYTYEISAYDMHLNRTSAFVTVSTPAASR